MPSQINTYFRKVFLFVTLCLFLGGCHEEKNPADVPPDLKNIPSFAGQWKIQGMEYDPMKAKPVNIIFIDPENHKAMLGNESYDLELDSLGLRIKTEDRENAVGYFLFSEIKEHTWVGSWEDRVIRLAR